MTSFMAGFVVFSVMGYMAHILHKENIEDVTTPGLKVHRDLLAIKIGSVLTYSVFLNAAAVCKEFIEKGFHQQDLTIK